MEDVLLECAKLAAAGVREITLLGQNVNGWREPGGDGDFADLLECVARVPGVDRIRFTTSHPIEFTDRQARAFAEIEPLASHLHLPVQSGSDRVLAAMKRRAHRPGIQKLHPQAAARPSGHGAFQRLYCGISRRNRKRFSKNAGLGGCLPV